MAFERSKVPAPASGVKGGAGRLQTGACCAEIGRLWDLLEDAFGPRASRAMRVDPLITAMRV